MEHILPLVRNVASLTLWLAILAAIFVPLERIFSLRPRERRETTASDIGYYFLNGLLPAAILSIPLGFLAMVMRGLLPADYVATIVALPLWAKLLLGLIVSDFGSYWGHRWSHSNPVLWRFHAVHHDPTSVDWLVNSRAHPIDMVFTRLCGLAPLYALGLADPGIDRTAMVPILVTLFGTVWTFFIHANVRWRFGPLEWLISTPAFHHWHHTNDEYRDHNFAAMLPLIDRAFGTAHLPKHWPPCYGIDEPVAPTMRDQLLTPFGPTPKRRLVEPHSG